MVWKSLTSSPTWEVKVREGRQKGGWMAGLTGRLATCDQQVVEDQVPHVTSDADKTGLCNQAGVLV